MDSITIKTQAPELPQLLALYDSVGWTNYTKYPDMLEAAVRGSLCCLSAYAGARLVGFLRLVGDGHSIVYVQDLLVEPDCQRRGIGRQLLQEMEQLYPTVYHTVLLTDRQPQTVHFYESCGFKLSEQYQCAAFVKFQR